MGYRFDSSGEKLDLEISQRELVYHADVIPWSDNYKDKTVMNAEVKAVADDFSMYSFVQYNTEERVCFQALDIGLWMKLEGFVGKCGLTTNFKSRGKYGYSRRMGFECFIPICIGVEEDFLLGVLESAGIYGLKMADVRINHDRGGGGSHHRALGLTSGRRGGIYIAVCLKSIQTHEQPMEL